MNENRNIIDGYNSTNNVKEIGHHFLITVCFEILFLYVSINYRWTLKHSEEILKMSLGKYRTPRGCQKVLHVTFLNFFWMSLRCVGSELQMPGYK